MKKTKVMAAWTAMAVIIFATACGNGSSDKNTKREEVIVTLDAETEARVSTVTISGDSFTLPCEVSEFTEKGYVWSYYEKPVDIDGIMLSGRSRMNNFTISKNDGKLTLVGVINTDAESKPISDCLVYYISYTNYDWDESHEEQNTDWEYMGITLKSDCEDVLEAFDGILEFENDEYALENTIGIDHRDTYRNIYFTYDTESDCIYLMGVMIFPNSDGWKYDCLSIS